jgi:diadenosine tetraphosphate (Ap4A) HIT family hydrolase
MRSRKEEKQYMHYLRDLRPSMCVFCECHLQKLVEDGRFFKVIRNIYPYSFWDNYAVDDHLLVVPKWHTDSLANLTGEQAIEFLSLTANFENQGYNVYARAPGSKAKSIYHQHTHLIKTSGNLKKLVLLIRKPYFRLVR